ncbi:MAG: hypothetical protein JNJ51_04825 [Methylobacillus glycogenes]|nr:hypothetical protein [Methylobacillus glycogenes]
MHTKHTVTPTYSSSSINAEPLLVHQSQLSNMQWKGLLEVSAAERAGREAVIADGIRDSLVELELILPDMERHHRITEKAKSLLQQIPLESH